MVDVCMENYDTDFRNLTREGNILMTGLTSAAAAPVNKLSRPSSPKKDSARLCQQFRKLFQAGTNNTLMGVEVPQLLQKLRRTFKPAEG